MEINKFYPLKVWLAVTFFVAFLCACWPALRFYPDTSSDESFLWRAGFFIGVFWFELGYSLHILIFLYLVFYFLAYRFFLSAIFVKSALFTCFLTSIFIAVHIYYPETWFHPFFIASSVLGAVIFSLFHVYYFDWEIDDWDTGDWESDYGRSMEGESGE